MNIAVLSGKGGTGKTFVSVNLAAVLPNSVYVDCDVEEPNGRLFFKPDNIKETTVTVKVPTFDEKLCTGCRACVDFCKFNALVFIKNKPMVFTDVCHACGGCSLVCKSGAVTETDRPVGKLQTGRSPVSEGTDIITGILNLGEASAVPVISKALESVPGNAENVITDCPPGSSCSVMESIQNADFCIIVAEGTAFGLHNFRMVYKLTALLKKKCAAVINKYDNEYPPLTEFCKENNIPILLKIPYEKEAGKLISEGRILSEEDPRYAEMFRTLVKKIGGDAE